MLEVSLFERQPTRLGKEPNPDESFRWCEKSTASGLSDSLLTLAEYYLEGYGCQRSLDRAESLFRDALQAAKRDGADEQASQIEAVLAKKEPSERKALARKILDWADPEEEEATAAARQKVAKSAEVEVTNLGLTLLDQHKYGEAIVEFRKAIRLKPDRAETHDSLGFALSMQDKDDEAIVEYQKALKINPKSADTHNNLGVSLSKKGRGEEATIEFLRALEINPNSADAHYNLGAVFAQMGRSEEAIVHYQKALEITPANAEIHNDLGIALGKKGDISNAIAQFQESLRLKPDFAAAQQNLNKARAMARQQAGEK